MEKKVFRSRISVLMALFILAIFAPIFVMLFQSGSFINPSFYILIGTSVIIVVLFGGMRYEITDEKLVFKMCGMKGWSIPIAQIGSVNRSYNPLAGPAASLKRLNVRFRKGDKWPPFAFTLISPAREQEFLATLIKINPNIIINVNNKSGWWRFWDWDI